MSERCRRRLLGRTRARSTARELLARGLLFLSTVKSRLARRAKDGRESRTLFLEARKERGALQVLALSMGVHVEGAKRPWPRRPELHSFLTCALVLCTCQSETENAPPPEVHVDAELHGYKALVEVGEELRYVLDDEIVIRIPEVVPDLTLAHVERAHLNEIALPAPETRGEHRLYRVTLETPPSSGDLVLRDAYDRPLRTWPLAPDVELPAGLKEILERGDDAASATAIENALADLAPRARVVALVALARIQQRGGNADAIIAAWDRAGEAALEAHVPTEASRCFRAAAYHAVTYRRFGTALDRLDRAESIDGPVEHVSGRLLAARYRALVLRERGDHRHAVEILTHAAAEARARGLDNESPWIVRMLALLLVELGRYREGLSRFEELGPRFLAGDEAEQSAFEVDRGWVLLRAMESRAIAWDLGQPRAALERARSLASSIGRRDLEADAMANLIWVAHLAGDRRRAEELRTEYDQLDPGRGRRGGLFVEIADGHLRTDAGDLRGALAAFSRARERALFENDGLESEYSWRALYGTASALRRNGQPGALQAVRRAVDAVLQLALRTDLHDSRALFLRDREQLFADAVEWSVDAEEEAAAFAFAEAAHTQFLRSLEGGLRGERLGPVERARLEALRAEYGEARAEYETGETERELLAGAALQRFEARRANERARLAELFERAYAYLDEVAPVAPSLPSIEAIWRALAPTEALVSVVALGDRYRSFLVRPGRLQTHLMDIPANALDSWRPELAGVTHVYLVAAAPGARDLHRAADPNGVFWLQHFSLSYLPYASVLERTVIGRSGRAVVAADPDDDLPEARVEAARVAERLGGSLHLIGAEVTRDALLHAIDHARVFHFAGHGRLEASESWDSHLDLANGEMLTLEDLIVSRPQVGLVVLSGCETASVADGQEIALADGFVLAGAQTVVAADGVVDDARAGEFIHAFYAAGGESDPVAAYRRVALASLTTGADVAFRVVGFRNRRANETEPRLEERTP
jgi:hypothetical protein